MSKRMLAVMGMAAALAACSDGMGPGAARTVSLTFTTGAAGGPLLSRMGVADDTIVSGNDVLVITGAQIVLREIELERQNDDACDDSGPGDDDACEEFETGPLLVDLPLGGAVETVITIEADTGTYDEIEFELHKPEDDGDPADAAFLAANPGFDRISVRVEGTWNGTPFVFTSDVNVGQEHQLQPPLVITETTGTNVTLQLDLSTWFRNESGVLVDPATGNKGGQNESIVNENIKNSVHAFEDHDRDGDDSDEG
jgi:hypothetical protein